MKKKYRETYSRFRAVRRVMGIIVAADAIRALYGQAAEQAVWETYLGASLPRGEFYVWNNRAAWGKWLDRGWTA